MLFPTSWFSDISSSVNSSKDLPDIWLELSYFQHPLFPGHPRSPAKLVHFHSAGYLPTVFFFHSPCHHHVRLQIMLPLAGWHKNSLQIGFLHLASSLSVQFADITTTRSVYFESQLWPGTWLAKKALIEPSWALVWLRVLQSLFAEYPASFCPMQMDLNLLSTCNDCFSILFWRAEAHPTVLNWLCA